MPFSVFDGIRENSHGIRAKVLSEFQLQKWDN